MNQSNQGKFRRWPYHEILEKHNAEFQLKESSELIQDRNKLGSRLCLAIVRGDNREVTHLLDAGAPVNHQDMPDGWTPLIYSVYYNNPDGRKLLIARGADILGTDFTGRTLLMFAALTGDPELTWELLKLGVPRNSADQWGRTALDFAMSGKCTECINILNNKEVPER